MVVYPERATRVERLRINKIRLTSGRDTRKTKSAADPRGSAADHFFRCVSLLTSNCGSAVSIDARPQPRGSGGQFVARIRADLRGRIDQLYCCGTLHLL